MAILRELPLRRVPEQIGLGDRVYRVRAFQPVAFVSVVVAGVEKHDERLPKFPALIDTGFNGEFAIREEQLREWAGIDPRLLTLMRSGEASRGKCHYLRANLWPYKNVRRSRALAQSRPILIEIDGGIQVFPVTNLPTDVRPDMPLVGVKALCTNRLRLVVDGQAASCSLTRRPSRWWPFRSIMPAG